MWLYYKSNAKFPCILTHKNLSLVEKKIDSGFWDTLSFSLGLELTPLSLLGVLVKHRRPCLPPILP